MKLQNIHAPWNPGFWRIQNLTFMASNIPIFRLLPVILIQLKKNTILFFKMFQHDVTELFAFCFQFVYLPFLFCDKHTEVHESPLWQPSSLNAKKRHGVQRPSWCIWSMAKRGTGTARGTGATPVKFSVSGMVIPATMIRSWYPPARGPHVMVSFFSDWRMGNPKNPTVLFFEPKEFCWAPSEWRPSFSVGDAAMMAFFFEKTCLMGSWNQDPGFFEKYWNTSRSNADWNHCLRQEYLRWFHLMD